MDNEYFLTSNQPNLLYLIQHDLFNSICLLRNKLFRVGKITSSTQVKNKHFESLEYMIMEAYPS